MTTTLDPALPPDGNWQSVANAVEDVISPDDIHQGPGEFCYIDAGLLGLAQTADGRAWILGRVVRDAATQKWGVKFTRNGADTIEEVPAEVAANFEDQPVGNIWPQVIQTAYAAYRTGADTLASENYGDPKIFLNEFGLPSNVPQPRGVAELFSMAAAGQPCGVATPDADGLRFDMVRDHDYAATPDGRLRNPWGAGAAMPQYITITDADVVNFGLTLWCVSAPPKASAPPPLALAVPQSPALPIPALTQATAQPTWGAGVMDLDWAQDDARDLTLYQATKSDFSDAVVLGNAANWQGQKGPSPAAWQAFNRVFVPIPTVQTYWRLGLSGSFGPVISYASVNNTVPAQPSPPAVPTLANLLAAAATENPSQPKLLALLSALVATSS